MSVSEEVPTEEIGVLLRKRSNGVGRLGGVVTSCPGYSSSTSQSVSRP